MNNNKSSILNSEKKIPNVCPDCWNLIETCHKSIFDTPINSYDKIDDSYIFVNILFFYMSILNQIPDKNYLNDLYKINISNLKQDNNRINQEKFNQIYYFHFGINNQKICNISYNQILSYLKKSINNYDLLNNINNNKKTTNINYI